MRTVRAGVRRLIAPAAWFGGVSILAGVTARGVLYLSLPP
nr:MAG TPA: hypothetical protein [Caudoviricetes sp.]